MASGPAINMAITVTFNVPMSSASNPKRGFSETGTQAFENKVLQVLSAPSFAGSAVVSATSGAFSASTSPYVSGCNSSATGSAAAPYDSGFNSASGSLPYDSG